MVFNASCLCRRLIQVQYPQFFTTSFPNTRRSVGDILCWSHLYSFRTSSIFFIIVLQRLLVAAFSLRFATLSSATVRTFLSSDLMCAVPRIKGPFPGTGFPWYFKVLTSYSVKLFRLYRLICDLHNLRKVAHLTVFLLHKTTIGLIWSFKKKKRRLRKRYQ